MKTPEQIAAETAEKIGRDFSLAPHSPYVEAHKSLILAALTEHAKGLEEENARRRFPHPELYNTRKLLGDVTAELAALRAVADEMADALSRALPYVVWTDNEGRHEEDYPESSIIVRRDQNIVHAALTRYAALRAGEKGAV